MQLFSRHFVHRSVKFGVIKSGNTALKQFLQTYGHSESNTFLNSWLFFFGMCAHVDNCVGAPESFAGFGIVHWIVVTILCSESKERADNPPKESF